MADRDSSDSRKARASAWFAELRDRFCQAFEAIETDYAGAFRGEPAGHFVRTDWKRLPEDARDSSGNKIDGGGGTMAVMRGRVFEKVGVNFSAVYGEFGPEFAKSIPGADTDPHYWASGISLVAHMRSPRVPAVHFNTRYIVTTKNWFGGGGDLTPMLSDQRNREHTDAKDFHAALKAACDRHKADAYERYAKWCDEYFFIKHRNEPRGVGGIFYDNLESGDFEANFSFTRDVGLAVLDAFPRIVRRAMNSDWTQAERDEQLVRRGRYVEFNLVYDRGDRKSTRLNSSH